MFFSNIFPIISHHLQGCQSTYPVHFASIHCTPPFSFHSSVPSRFPHVIRPPSQPYRAASDCAQRPISTTSPGLHQSPPKWQWQQRSPTLGAKKVGFRKEVNEQPPGLKMFGLNMIKQPLLGFDTNDMFVYFKMLFKHDKNEPLWGLATVWRWQHGQQSQDFNIESEYAAAKLVSSSYI